MLTDNCVISVRRTSNYTVTNGIYTDTTKTKKSQRTQKYPQYVMDMLWELRKEQDEQALKYGDKWVETDRLYTKWNGEPMQNGTPYFWLNEFCEKKGIRFCDIHSLSHPDVKYKTKNNCDNLMKFFPIRRMTAKGTRSLSCCREKHTPALSTSPQAI